MKSIQYDLEQVGQLREFVESEMARFATNPAGSAINDMFRVIKNTTNVDLADFVVDEEARYSQDYLDARDRVEAVVMLEVRKLVEKYMDAARTELLDVPDSPNAPVLEA